MIDVLRAPNHIENLGATHYPYKRGGHILINSLLSKKIIIPVIILAILLSACTGNKGIDGREIEEMEESYKNGFQLIEMDFEWTKDNHLVVIDDWADMARRMFMDMEEMGQ